MRANELGKYKTLDITELSGSPWNNAEKVLGLDENDKVIMAEPDDVVTPEYVDNAIDQAMEAETARTEDAYAKKDEIPDMEDYYTKEEVDEAISGITVDLSDYYTKDETDQAISAATQDLASTDYVDDAIAAIPEPDLSDYYTKDETDGAISTALVPYATKGWVSSQSYANQNYVMFKVNEAMQIETARTESTYAKPSDIPSLDGYATEEYVDNAVSSATQDMATEQYVNDAIAAIPGVDLSDYALISSVTADINTAIANETARTESTYAKPSQIPSLDGYATEQWVESRGYLTEHQDLSAYAKTTAVTEDIQTAMAAETARTESTYLKEHQSLDNYYTKSQVDAEISGATEGLASEQYVDDAIAAIPAVDLSPYAKTTAVTQDIQTAMAAETARTESTYLKEHQSLDNYYTKSEVDADFVSAATSVGEAIDAAVQGLASEDYVNNAVSGLASEDYVDNAVTSATEGLASEEYVDNAVAGIVFPDDYATTGDVASAVEGLASESYVDDAITSATQGMATQSDLEGLASESYVDDAVNGLAQGIGMLGMVNDVSEDNGTVTVQKTTMQEGQLVTGSTSFNIATPGDIQTAIASETARTESTYLKEHQSLDNYYTKSEVDAEITGATEDMATKTWVGQQGYLTQHQDISGKLDKTDFDTYTGATETALAEKLDTTAFTQGMASETARTESVYAKKAEIPSLNGYATEAWVEGKGYITGVTVDDELTSGSTNAVQSKAIYEALNGVSSSTQMEISEVTSDSIYASVFMLGSGYKNCYLKETNIPGYYVLDIDQTVQDYSFTGNTIRLNGIYVGTTYNRVPQIVYLTTENYGDIIKLSTNGSNLYFQVGENYMDNFNYYLIYSTNENSIFFSKTVPVITTVSDHKANLSDLPTAQDGSDFNQFVYLDTTNQYSPRKVISVVGHSLNADIVDTKLKPSIQTNLTYWNNQGNNTATFSFPYGNEFTGGIKTPRDSKIINTAAEALNGFTEEITLTIGSASTDSFNLYGNKYFYETNDPRYIAYPVSELNKTGLLSIYYFTIGGNQYGVLETNTITSHQEQPIVVDWRCSYHLIPGSGSGSPMFQYPSSPAEQTIPYVQYIIVDKEAKTLILSDSLTITRAKNIQQTISAATQNYVTSGDVATQIGTAIENETARTESTYAKPSQIPSLNGYATEQWVQNQGYLTQHQSLAEYYTKTEIDDMIGDIESLLASI